jgi:glycosyltransferase involved in cell wall biosynthesis
MKILLVNQHTVPVFADIALAFADAGHQVTLFAGHVEEGSRKLDGVVVRNSIRYRRKSAVTRLLTWFAFTAHYSLHLLCSRKPDYILVSTNPPLAPVVTGWIAAWRGVPFHVLIYDLYPEALAQAGFMSQSSPFYRNWQRRNRRTFATSKGLVTLSDSMKVAVSAYADPDRIKVIYNWADTSYIRPLLPASNTFLAKHGLQGKCVVMYSGNMGLTHDLESVVDAAALLKDDSRLVFVMIGEGGKRKKLMDMAAARNLGNVLFLPYQSAYDFPLAAAAADIGIVTLGTGAEGISVPSKTYIGLAAGQCLLAVCPAQSELARIVDQFKVGYSVEPGQPQLLAERIRHLLDHPGELAHLKDRAREVSAEFTAERARDYVMLISPKDEYSGAMK